MAKFKAGDQVVITVSHLGHQGEKGTIVTVFEDPSMGQDRRLRNRFRAPKANPDYYGVHLEGNFPGDYAFYRDSEIARR